VISAVKSVFQTEAARNHFRLEAKEKPPIPDGHLVRIVFHAYFDLTNIA